MHSIVLAGAFLLIVLVPGIIAARLQGPEESGAGGYLTESLEASSWTGVARGRAGQHSFASKSSERWQAKWFGRGRKQWRTS